MKPVKECYWNMITGGMLVLLVFLFFLIVYPYHLFFREQTQFFLMTGSYVSHYLDKPAWLSDYIGDFLTQFFYLRGGGPIVIALVLLLEWWLTVRLLRFPAGLCAPFLALLPVAVEVGLLCRIDYDLSAPVALILIMLFQAIYPTIKSHTLSAVYGFLMIPLLYTLCGATALIWPFFLIFTGNGFRHVRWFYLLLILICTAAVPFALRPSYHITLFQAYTLPASGYKLFLAGAIILLLLASLQKRFIRRAVTRMLAPETVVFCVIVVAFLSVWRNADFTREEILKFDSESYFGNWGKILREADSKHLSLMPATYFTNIALAHEGQLAEKLLDYYQPSTDGLYYSLGPSSGWMDIFFSGEVWYQLGDMNMAQHSAMLAQTFSPRQRSSRMARRMAEINMAVGDAPAARKFLRMLEAAPFHRRWALQQEALLNDPTRQNRRLEHIRSLVPLSDTLRAGNDYITGLKLLAKLRPDRKDVKDYLLCSYLLKKDIANFAITYNELYRDQRQVAAPIYYQALLIWLAGRKVGEKEVAAYHIPVNIVHDFKNYTEAYEAGGGSRKSVEKRFSKSYWFYFHFAQMKK